MKKTMLPILLACQLVVSLAMTGFAATDQVTYPIGAISPVGYLLDDDTSRVDFQDSAGSTRVRYGETVYYPLLNKPAEASEEQLLARTAQLTSALGQEQELLGSLYEDFETAERNLKNAVNAVTLSREMLASDLESLLDTIDAETIGAEDREAQIAALRGDLADQKVYLDSAVEIDSAAADAVEEILGQINRAEEELKTLRALAPLVRERERLEGRWEELDDAIIDSGDLLDSTVLEMADPSLTTAALKGQLRTINEEIEGADAMMASILDTSLLSGDDSSLLPGDLRNFTDQNYEQAYQPYLEARTAYRNRSDEERLDSGAEDYMDDPRPDPDDYPKVVVRYGEAVKELLDTYQGIDGYDRSSITEARNLADSIGKVGRTSDEADKDGSLYARQYYWQQEKDRLLDERALAEDELAISRRRDEIQSGLRKLQEEQRELEETLIPEIGERIAALAEQAPSLALEPENLSSRELGGEADGSDAGSLIGEQQDRLADLRRERDDRKAEKTETAEALAEEQAAYDAIDRKLAALTDPDAPTALARATRLRQNYPFLLLPQSLQDAKSAEELADSAVLDKLEELSELFSGPIPEQDQELDSESELLGVLRPYESYRAAQRAFEIQLPRNKELQRSATAAALAFEQAAPDSVKYPYVYENKAVDGVRLKSKWEEGKRYVDEISLVKKRYQYDSGYTGTVPSDYIYFIALKIKDRDTTSTGSVDLFGTISMKKSSRSDSLNKFDYDEMELEVSLELGFDHPDDANLIPIDPAAFHPDEDFDEDDEETFDFEADGDSYYVANTKNQKKLVLGLNTDYDEEIGDLYADQTANLFFWNGNGGSFNRSGYLYLAADGDGFVYKVNDRGALVPVNAEYDDYEGCYVIRTRTLGRYVVSDVELTLADPWEDDPEEAVVTVITPDDNPEPEPAPAAPAKPSGWSQGSRSDEEEAPVSSAPAPSEPEPAPSSDGSGFTVSGELPATAGSGDISVPLLIGISVAAALVLTLVVFLIIGIKSGKFRKQ